MFASRIYQWSLLLVLGWFLLIPKLVWAEDPKPTLTVPELNPICWQVADCNNIRKQLGAPNGGVGGWLKEAGPECAKPDWGKCLPAGASKISISIGGKAEFADVGEYIVTVYNYAMIVAAILAVIMIIVVGAQWITSAGSSDMISSAKKRITGALVGLLIAYLSYAILNTLNPNLVSLRLPQVYMIRPVVIAPEYCADFPNARPPAADLTTFAFAGENGQKPTPASASTKFDQFIEQVDAKGCGAQYYARGSSDIICVSSNCVGNSNGRICSKKQEQTLPGKNEYECSSAAIRGTVIGTYIVQPNCASSLVRIFKGFASPYLTRQSGDGLQAVFQDKTDQHYYFQCIGGECRSVSGSSNIQITDIGKTQNFKLEFDAGELDNFIKNNTAQGLVGFIPVFAFTNVCFGAEQHMIGKNGQDLGYALPTKRFEMRDNVQISPNDFFTPEELKKGAVLNIDVSKITPN
ncbi:MAG: pilin [bacterium]|nr:pilin [bacterium]